MNQYPSNQSQARAEAQDATFSNVGSRVGSAESAKVLRNTYMLLALTLAFSAITAGAGMALGMPYMGLWTLLPYFVLLFMVEKNKNKASGIAWVFALTGWLGLTLILISLAGTAGIFFATSGYVLVTRKNLSFMTGFLMTGIIVAFVAGIANYFLQIPGLGMAVSAMFMFLASGLIMWQTSEIIHGGETNYISATVLLYVMIYNLFLSLLSLLGLSND